MKPLALTLLVILCASCAQSFMATPEERSDYLKTEQARCEHTGKDFYSGYHHATGGYMAACVARP